MSGGGGREGQLHQIVPLQPSAQLEAAKTEEVTCLCAVRVKLFELNVSSAAASSRTTASGTNSSSTRFRLASAEVLITSFPDRHPSLRKSWTSRVLRSDVW